jgi:hypothetical protein
LISGISTPVGQWLGSRTMRTGHMLIVMLAMDLAVALVAGKLL